MMIANIYAGAMTIPVAVADLRSKTAEYRWAYVVTVRDDQTPHIVAVSPAWSDGELVFDVGRTTAANTTSRSNLTLCYPPPPGGDGYSLIVDGDATVDERGQLRFRPRAGILHRPAPE